MALIDSFTLVRNDRKEKRKNEIFLTLYPRKIDFSTAFVTELDHAPYVAVYQDHAGKRLAFVADEHGAFPFCKKRPDGSYIHTTSADKELRNLLRSMSGVLGDGQWRFYGEAVTDNGQKLILINIASPEKAFREV